MKQEWSEIGSNAADLLSVREEVDAHRTRVGVVVDRMGSFLADPAFFAYLLAAHLAWVLVNLPWVPWRPWDPYPFVFLATVASAEAPFLALLILISQRRDSRVTELREEVALQVSLHLERQTSMLLRMLRETETRLGVETEEESATVDHFSTPLDTDRLLENLRRRLRENQGGEATAP